MPVTLKQSPDHADQAIVAIEDDRFYEHGALDLKGTLRAMLRNQSDGRRPAGRLEHHPAVREADPGREGQDTPAEVADATADTYQRKIAELRYAIAVEKQYSKDEILDRYLNLANFGDGAYGIQAAAQHYYGVNASKLTLPQAAMLAGLVKNPTGYDPTNDLERAKDRRDVVLRRMLELNVISVHQANPAPEDAGDRPGQGRPGAERLRELAVPVLLRVRRLANC